ncbi:unnamed protein product [Meganyctiphanes norvegica]|uniref:Serpin domain-containing protein n=1 Tax=Meganyctiphanes norvegica TaxID=48144 RepID=A0AAV2R894_MEGNR
MGRQYIAVIAVVAVATIVSGQQNVAPCFQEDANTKQSGRLGVEEFGMNLFREVASNTDKSIIISAYSIWSAFLLAYFGSGGRTQQQLERVLGVEGKTSTFQRFKRLQFLIENPFPEDGAVVSTMNKAYFDQRVPLKKCISQLIHNTEHINFRNFGNAAEIINQATSEATRGKITNLVEPRSLIGATFVLLNAIYFQGKWETPFKTREIVPTDFKDSRGNVIGQVDMMYSQRQSKISQAPALGAEILELPYANSSISMFLILPDGVDVNNVLRRLTPENFQKSLEKHFDVQSLVGVPKFKLETTLNNDLKQAMNLLGVTDLFSGQANLTSFSNVPLRADSVVHKAVVEVSEEGTVAAAATAIIGTRSGGRRKNMVFDKPFIFLIHDKQIGVSLFTGIFRHPDDVTTV